MPEWFPDVVTAIDWTWRFLPWRLIDKATFRPFDRHRPTMHHAVRITYEHAGQVRTAYWEGDVNGDQREYLMVFIGWFVARMLAQQPMLPSGE